VTARALAVEGAQVVFCGRRAEEGKAVEKSIRDAGGEATFVQADVTVEAQVQALVQGIDARHGRLDYAFNNVGTSDGSGLLHELSTDYFDLVMTTNLRGNFLQMKYEIPLMLRTGAGVILGNSSIAGLRYLANKPHYTAAKHGVIGMYCAAALAYAGRNLRINVICPGLIKTEKAMRVLGGNEKALDARIPAGHIGESADVAAAVLWLFSDEARYITGAVLPIDGGQSVA
jgi:NAD(P)-dependent dehydrogenase (short-subunit alcohol dehydrogenase family)